MKPCSSFKTVVSWERWVDWLEDAEDDYAAATDLARLGRYSKACFLSQQAAEKALKALLMARVGRYERTHSVYALLLTAERSGIEVPQELKDAAEELDRHYVPSRYPNAWPWGPPHAHYREKDAENCLKNAKTILEYVKSLLRGS